MEQNGQRSQMATRRENPRYLLCDRPLAETRDASQRQLPTDHDCEGELSSILEYQSDQPSSEPLSTAVPSAPDHIPAKSAAKDGRRRN